MDEHFEMDEGEFAQELAARLQDTPVVQLHGWGVLGLDIGEIHISTPDGNFVLTVRKAEVE